MSTKNLRLTIEDIDHAEPTKLCPRDCLLTILQVTVVIVTCGILHWAMT